MATDTEKYARRCDVTGKGINSGYCIGDGQKYISEHFAMLQHITDETEYNTIEEAHEDDYYYWTQWEVEEGENYFDEAGNEYDSKTDELILDLFANQEFLPSEAKQVIEKWEKKHFDFTYEECEQFVSELETVGYTCEYYLDAIPFNLKKL